jgi:hypothetical protein
MRKQFEGQGHILKDSTALLDFQHLFFSSIHYTSAPSVNQYLKKASNSLRYLFVQKGLPSFLVDKTTLIGV